MRKGAVEPLVAWGGRRRDRRKLRPGPKAERITTATVIPLPADDVLVIGAREAAVRQRGHCRACGSKDGLAAYGPNSRDWTAYEVRCRAHTPC